MTEPHLDLDALADLLVGEGTEVQAAHVAGCAGCSARLVELDEAQAPVAAALAGLPAPQPPPGLAERLTAALDAADPLPAVEPEGPRDRTALPPPDAREDLLAPVGEAARTVTPLRRPAPRRHPLPTWLPGAAVVVLVLSGAGLAVSGLQDGAGDDSETASVAGGGAEDSASRPEGASRQVVTNESGRDYAAGPEVFDELLPDVLQGTAGPEPAPMSGPASPGGSPDEDSAVSAQSGPALDRLRDPAALEGCLSALLPPDGSVQPLAVDYAAYDGQPALVVVLSSGDPGTVDVYVVGPDCAPGNDSTLFFTRLDRPA